MDPSFLFRPSDLCNDPPGRLITAAEPESAREAVMALGPAAGDSARVVPVEDRTAWGRDPSVLGPVAEPAPGRKSPRTAWEAWPLLL
jgi:hypothetical protein